MSLSRGHQPHLTGKPLADAVRTSLLSPRMHIRDRDAIPQGTLDMLILRTLVRCGASHGFEIAEEVSRTSANVLQVEEGSLYPALQRLLLRGSVTAEWGRTDRNRPARYYKITAAGRRALDQQVHTYWRIAHAIARVLETA